jgi:hypothetical protein
MAMPTASPMKIWWVRVSPPRGFDDGKAADTEPPAVWVRE